LQTRKWQDKESKDRYTTEVVLQDFRGQIILLDGKSSNVPVAQSSNTNVYGIDDDSSEIPF